MIKREKVRLDQLMVARGLEENHSRAKARIMAGDVWVNDQRVDKPGTKVWPEVELRLRANSHPFVSRGGLKLQEALATWPAPVEGAVCLDVGASTGGFTQVLLVAGARKVYAVDVGYGQLAHELRTDSRVVNLERTHILHMPKEALVDSPSIAVIDVSFISLCTVLPAVVSLLAAQAEVYALIKPQFEVGRANIAKGGIVKDEAARQIAVQKVLDTAQNLGLMVRGVKESPITGAKGNVEYIAAFRWDKH